MLRVEQQIVTQIVALQRRQPAQEVAAEHKAVVRFIVHDMTDADHARMVSEALELRFDIVSAHVYPADNAANQIILLSERKQKFGLADDLPRLHRHRAVNAGGRQQRLHIRRHIIDLQRTAVARHPAVVFRVVKPEVLMRVDSFGHRFLPSKIL